MKIQLKIILTCLCLLFSMRSARAGIGLGYETMIIFPHAFTATYLNEDTGWGLKASADFGTSWLSALAKTYTVDGTFGVEGAKYSFYTLGVLKDYASSDKYHAFVKLGGELMVEINNGAQRSIIRPLIGCGWEWKKLYGGPLALAVEIDYPEVLTLGLKWYFN